MRLPSALKQKPSAPPPGLPFPSRCTKRVPQTTTTRGRLPNKSHHATNTSLQPQQQRADPLVRNSLSSWILPEYAPITKYHSTNPHNWRDNEGFIGIFTEQAEHEPPPRRNRTARVGYDEIGVELTAQIPTICERLRWFTVFPVPSKPSTSAPRRNRQLVLGGAREIVERTCSFPSKPPCVSAVWYWHKLACACCTCVGCYETRHPPVPRTPRR